MSSRRWIVPLLAAAAVFALLFRGASAQQGRKVAEGLLRGFLEPRLEQDRKKAIERRQWNDRQRHPNRPIPSVPSPHVVSPQQRTYRTTLGYFATQSAALTDGLQRSRPRVRGVRPLMADALKLKTTAAIMHRHSQTPHDLALLREEYSDLDRQWRGLSFRLKQLQGLDPSTMGFIRQLDGYCDSLCGLLELRPQFGRQDLFRLAVETTAHLDTLLDDVEYELYGLKGAGPLSGECRGLSEQCRRLSNACGELSYEDLITRYSAFVSDWRKFAARLYPYRNRNCDRGIRRIRSCNQRVFETLWRPLPIDRDYLHYVSELMADEVNFLLENMTVKALVQMPPAQQQSVLTTARALFGHCDRYCAGVKKNVPLNDLMSAYLAIDDQWGALDRHLHSVTSKSVVTSRRRIAAYDQELRSMLQVPARLDRAHATRLAASLETMAQNLRYDIRRYGRYYRSASYRNQAYLQSDSFYAQAKDLHLQLQKGAGLKDLQRSCDTAVTNWESFSNTISSMPNYGVSSSRYEYVNASRQELLPVIAELAALLGA